MKIKFYFTFLLLFITSDLFCQNYFQTHDSEMTKLTKPEREAINHIIKIYSVQAEKEISKRENKFGYVLDVFPKIDSLQRYYIPDKANNKIYLFSEIKFRVGQEENGYFGDAVDIIFSPDFSLEHGYINLNIEYPAAGVSDADITFVLNNFSGKVIL